MCRCSAQLPSWRGRGRYSTTLNPRWAVLYIRVLFYKGAVLFWGPNLENYPNVVGVRDGGLREFRVEALGVQEACQSLRHRCVCQVALKGALGALINDLYGSIERYLLGKVQPRL